MTSLNSKTLKVFGLLLLFLTAASSCKNNDVINPVTPTSTLTGTIDGKTLDISQAAISSTFFSTAGDNVSALQTTAVADAGASSLTFYIPDISVADNTITPKLGTSSNPGNANLKVQGAGATTTVTQVYVSYKTGGNTYYAISGTVTVTTDNTKVTVKWNLTFTDATGRTFTSTGSFIIYNYKAVTKPKTEITDPTPVAARPTIDNIASNFGAAGDSVVIAGTNFSTTLTDNIVKFNGVAATVKSATATKLVVTVPSTGSTGAVSVKVKNSETTTGPIFTYVASPIISGVTPLSGKAGAVMTIIGNNFSTVLTDDVVTINGTAAVVLTSSVDRMTVTVPQGVTTGQVVVKIRGKVATVTPGISTLFTVTL
ncbi:IPT/TIG domain-containing protein [Mucilaginibacter boryungensis]|uniref:IPT/TIG domain-containing protein n=1 Tax=Mucilaginibacter boryungensis TaxID=768480 RepID=A0ABR9XJF8_9SPHI|nr:IPT/TIG domain-containing protein [Mucilaginibacter boryungensis]MBE9667514.1 IPT/TIG domain-containing protein [Mucilaginibacter boryungensis]